MVNNFEGSVSNNNWCRWWWQHDHLRKTTSTDSMVSVSSFCPGEMICGVITHFEDYLTVLIIEISKNICFFIDTLRLSYFLLKFPESELQKKTTHSYTYTQ